MEPTIRLVIADDHEIFRDGLALMLARQEDLSLVGQAEDGKELIELAEKLQPDVVITDIRMPHLDGIQATRLLIQKYPDLKIIALSMFDEDNLIVEMLEAGAKGYLLKNADKKEILEAIETVYRDRIFYCRHTSARLASMIVKSKFDQQKKRWKSPFLTGKRNHQTHLQAKYRTTNRRPTISEQAHRRRLPGPYNGKNGRKKHSWCRHICIEK